MLLKIRDLSIQVDSDVAQKELVKNVSLDIPEQKIVALVGGSGSGKTTTGLSILRLLAPELSVTSGKIFLNDENIFNFSEHRMQKVRGKEISMIFQEPLNAFNPVFTVSHQINEVLMEHTNYGQRERQERILYLLDTVGVPDAGRVAQSYPHQLSGGLRQRAMVAQAIAGDPKLIIADEPTSSLDVTLQARVMELFTKLKDDLKISFLLITHDLGVVKHLADEVYVMTAGSIVESGKTAQVLDQPQHEYTRQLMEALIV